MNSNAYVLIKNKISLLKADFEKLKAVDDLLGSEVTWPKKMEILAMISLLREIQQEIIDKYQTGNKRV